ncbi:MAG TPA: hypothetical protein VMY18_00290 [Acidobacteriota bacterium]|nr:hypothetical protein [Acidobacteriota bacterium]
MIVAICGQKGTGKSTAAEYVSKAFGFETYALAQPLKDALKAMFGYDDSRLNGEAKEYMDSDYGISPREMLQTLGTEWGQYALQQKNETFRYITGRGIWVKRFQYMVWDPKKDWVISDVRFQHELDELGRLDKTISIRLFRGHGPVTDLHESEDMALRTDYAIFNDSDHTVLYQKLRDILRAHPS